ncbi:hypothetical protein FO519_007884 [Halicephalobus sp. NKZ332]|nr:hypothetical protein FO519_007884 [Halicephalobus sp. NKZ332]
MDEDRSPKFFTINVEKASKFVAVSDVGLTALLFVNLISSVAYGTPWLNSTIGLVSLSVAVGSLVSFWFGLNEKDYIYLILPVIFQTISFCWSLILILAGIFCITSGHLWPLESVLGIKPAEIKTSKDIRDTNYISPDDTNPETSRAILWGQIAIVFALLLLILKLWSYIVLKMTYSHYLKYDIYNRFDYPTKYSEVAQKEYDDEDLDEYDYEEN